MMRTWKKWFALAPVLAVAAGPVGAVELKILSPREEPVFGKVTFSVQVSDVAGVARSLQMARNPAAMNEAMRSFTATKSSDRQIPPDNLSIRPVRASVTIKAPVTK